MGLDGHGNGFSTFNKFLRKKTSTIVIDAKGGVHFHFDGEFARVTAAAIAILQLPRYANSLDEFNKSLAALSEAAPDGKEAIRHTFTAIEGLFALMFPEVRRLAAGEVSRLRACRGSRPSSSKHQTCRADRGRC